MNASRTRYPGNSCLEVTRDRIEPNRNTGINRNGYLRYKKSPRPAPDVRVSRDPLSGFFGWKCSSCGWMEMDYAQAKNAQRDADIHLCVEPPVSLASGDTE